MNTEQQLRSALNAMLTQFGMDEDEWNKPTFDQARRALDAQPFSSQGCGGDGGAVLTDDEIDGLQEEYDCFGQCDAPRIHDFARGVEKAVRAALSGLEHVGKESE